MMSSHPELKEAVLPETIDRRHVKHLFSLLDVPAIEEQAIVRKIAALDFINRMFEADKSGKHREIFLENGIFQKLNLLLEKSTRKDDKLSLLVSTASLGLVYRLLSTPRPNKVTIPFCFLEYFLIMISENKLDSAVKLAVSCVCLLDWEEPERRESFINSFGFESLLKTAKCCSRDVTIDIIKVFANFAIKADTQNKLRLIDVGVMKYIVGILDLYLQKKIQFGGNVDNLLTQCMIFLNNFMLNFYRGKLEFYKLGGMEIISELYFVQTDEQFKKAYIERVLKILLYYNPKKKQSDFFMFMNRCGELTLRKRYPPGPKVVEECLTDSRLQREIIAWDKSAAETTEVERSYQINSVVPFVSDSTRAILPSNTFLPAKMDEVGSIACGMLNYEKYCTIYFGISDSKVEGMKLDRDMKDKFRLSVVNIFTALIKPAILMSSNVDVQFIPIKDGEDVIQDLAIIEIQIKPHHNFFSYRNKTYLRCNDENMLINAEMLQQLVVCEEKNQWLWKEEKCLKKLNDLKVSKALMQVSL